MSTNTEDFIEVEVPNHFCPKDELKKAFGDERIVDFAPAFVDERIVNFEPPSRLQKKNHYVLRKIPIDENESRSPEIRNETDQAIDFTLTTDLVVSYGLICFACRSNSDYFENDITLAPHEKDIQSIEWYQRSGYGCSIEAEISNNSLSITLFKNERVDIVLKIL